METLQRTANRGSISTGYDIDNSLKFERANSEQIFTSNAASGNRKTWTFSAWIKRTQLSQDYHTIFSCGYSNIQIMSNDRPRLILYNGSAEVYADPEMLLRDTAAWYHIVVQVDSTQSTASDRVKWYINGDRITNFNNSTYTNMSQDEDFDFGQAGSGSGNWLRLGEFFGGSEGFSGYMSDVYYLNGTAAQASDFGKYDSDSGIWIPKEYTGSGYGTQGFKYEFKDSSALGTDTSGEGHNANNLSNITAADQATDTPTNNFATLNVLNRNSASSGVTNNSVFTEGNTKITGNLNGYWQSGVSTIGITSGKWYFEARAFDSDTKICTIGYGDEADIENWGRNNDFPGAASSKSYGYAGGTASGYGQIIPSTNKPSPAVTYNQTNIIGVAIDADNGYVYWSKDGSYVNSGDPASGSSGTGGIAIPTGAGTNGTLFPAVGFYYDSTVPIMLVNFGGYTTISISSAASDDNGYGTFEYAPPSGYFAICTKNLAEHG